MQEDTSNTLDVPQAGLRITYENAGGRISQQKSHTSWIAHHALEVPHAGSYEIADHRAHASHLKMTTDYSSLDASSPLMMNFQTVTF